MALEGRSFKDLSELTLMDDYMFGAVMQDPEIAKLLIEKILDIQIRHIEYVEPQKTMKERHEARGIRLDLYVEDENGVIFNVEVQTSSKKNLPRRMRYYQSVIDMHILRPGVDYKELRKSYVIFICDYDPFEQGRYIYHFENRCGEDRDLTLGDDTYKVVVNTKGSRGDISDELKEMLGYLNGQKPEDEMTRLLEKAVNDVKESEERRHEYMVMMIREMELREEAAEEGRKQGMAQGMAQGQNRFARLTKKLVALSRLDDLTKAADDPAYCEELFKEFGIA